MTYRAEIDFLRAISILFVVGYHFFPELFPGGFTGVDVFFVISGYLVTAIIQHDVKNKSFSYVNFYKRRILRLFPVLVIVLASSLCFGYFFLLADEFKSLAELARASSFFVTNFVLYFQSGYFDTESSYKSLLHLWSLAVEEQFYLIWPCLMLFLISKFKNYFKFLLALALLSFGANIYFTFNDGSFAYFLPLARFWQFIFGIFIALFRTDFFQFTKKVKSAEPVAFFLGLTLLCVSPFVISKAHLFPGFWALIPTLGAFLFLISNPPDKFDVIFKNKVFLYIGKISYPLYLWHWVLLSNAKILAQWDFSLTFNFTLIAIALVLSIFSYHFIEIPIRKRNTTKMWPIVLLLALLFIGLYSSYVVNQKGLPERFPSLDASNQQNTDFIATDKHPGWAECTKHFLTVEMCAISDLKLPPTVALIGDSHASQYFPGFKKYYDQQGQNLLLLAKSGTLPFIDVSSVRKEFDTFADIFHYLESSETIHTIILGAFWPSYSEQDGVTTSFGLYKNYIFFEDASTLETIPQRQHFEMGLENTIINLRKMNKKIIFIADIPSLPFHPRDCLPRPNFNSVKDCRFSVQKYLVENSFVNSLFRNAKKKHDFIQTLNPTKFICDISKKSDQCNVFSDEKLLYSDSHHLSVSGAEIIVEKLLQESR